MMVLHFVLEERVALLPAATALSGTHSTITGYIMLQLRALVGYTSEANESKQDAATPNQDLKLYSKYEDKITIKLADSSNH
jgi:hypothetical protein